VGAPAADAFESAAVVLLRERGRMIGMRIYLRVDERHCPRPFVRGLSGRSSAQYANA
jgi:hypothetical protein